MGEGWANVVYVSCGVGRDTKVTCPITQKPDIKCRSYEMKKALIVIDMLNDFINPDGAFFCGPTAEAIVPYVKERVDNYRKEGHPVIFLGDAHAENDKEFSRFPKHCVDGTKGAEIIDILGFKVGQDSFIRKTRYSGFYDTTLEFTLMVHFWLLPEQSTVEVCGVCTSVCVMDTVGGLANRDYNIVIHKDCVADFDPDMHKFALKRMESLYGVKYV